MKVERIHVDRFGRIEAWDTGSEPLPGLVAVLGPNEAGKSTLFHFLTSLLYGFYPASRDGNPYTPWDGAEPAGGMTVELDGGGCVEIERRLRSQPTGRMTRGGAVEELRNRTLPWAEHVPRTVFLQVFALTLDEVAGLEEETWARIQDRIVGSMGASDILPARHVVNDLEQAAGELWRPSRRGNQRIRDIQKAILELRDRLRSAGDRDRAVRERVAELERAREELKLVRHERNQARLSVERIQALAPTRNQLRRIAFLREAAASPESLEGLPGDPAAEVAAARKRIQDLATRLDETLAARVEPEAAVGALGERERRILSRSADISALSARVSGLRGDRTRLAGLEQEIRDLHRRLETQSSHLLERLWSPDLEGTLMALPLAELRERVRRARALSERTRSLEAVSVDQASGPTPTAPSLTLTGSLLVLVPGLLLLLVGVLRGGVLATAAGSAGSAVGLAFLTLWWWARRVRQAERSSGGRLEDRAKQARAALDAARAAVAQILEGLPVAPGLLAEPDETLALGIERLQEILRDVKDRSRVAEDLRQGLEDADTRAGALARDLDLGAEGNAEASALLQERELRRAESLSQEAAAAQRELHRLDREEDRLREEADAERSSLRSLEGRLTEAGQGDLDQGIRSVRERIQARDRAEKLEDELRRAHPDLDELRARIAEAEERGDAWTVDDTDLARRKAQVEELTERVETLATRAESLDRDIAHLLEGETADVIEGEIAALQLEETVLLRERDRLWVLAQLLKEADRRFREEHQPDLLRRAAGHLSVLTGGRYDRIVVEESSGGERFRIGGPNLPDPVPLAHPISTGTLEQAYLAIRLAIVDHLDQGLEKLPLFVDEVLVNWDERRRRHGVELLGGLSRHRQIFVFTCHPHIAEELAGVGARVLDLGTNGHA